MKIEYDDGMSVEYDDSPAVHKAVFDYLMEHFFKEYEHFTGEGIMQADKPQINAPVVLSHIADDVIKFKVDWGE